MSTISGSGRQTIWKASEPASKRVRPEPGWQRHIIAVSNLPPRQPTSPPPFTAGQSVPGPPAALEPQPRPTVRPALRPSRCAIPNWTMPCGWWSPAPAGAQTLVPAYQRTNSHDRRCLAGGVGLCPPLAGGDVLSSLQDGPGHGESPALVLGKPVEAAAHGQPGLRFPALLAGAKPRPLGPGTAPALVPQNGRAVPPSRDTALQIASRPERPMADPSPFPHSL